MVLFFGYILVTKIKITEETDMTTVKDRFSIILTTDEMNRTKISEKDNGITDVSVDVHGLNVKDSKRLVNNIINLAPCKLQLHIIHGYRHGTAIKTMINTRLFNEKIEGIYPDERNMGLTHIYVL